MIDVAVVGDGPGGMALAAAARDVGLAVLVVGDGAAWPATYGTWRDDVAALPDHCFVSVAATTIVHGHRRHELARAYGVFDNGALRAHLGAGVDELVGHAERVRHTRWGSRLRTTAGTVDARIVVLASGYRPPPQATQTAYGLVLDELPDGVDAGGPTLMDLRPAGDGPPTFCYAVPVADGWLVEETVLAADPVVPTDVLRARLAARIGRPDVVRTEEVTIPMGGPLPGRGGRVPMFGAAAGYVHPASGFSVAPSLRAAPRVAAALADVCASRGRPDPRPVWDAVWPRALRRTRRLHRYGLEVVRRLDQDELAVFFDAFFDLPVDMWAPYLRIDASAAEVSRTMTGVSRRLPPAVRRQLLVDPRRAWS